MALVRGSAAEEKAGAMNYEKGMQSRGALKPDGSVGKWAYNARTGSASNVLARKHSEGVRPATR